MTNPTNAWDKVTIFGKYLNLDGTPKSGTVVFTLAERIYRANNSTIYPAGGKLTVSLGAETGSFSVGFPASDDPDIFPNGWLVKVEERLIDNSGKTYYVEPKLAYMADGGAGLDLTTVYVPAVPMLTPDPALIKGVPGGVAELDADGDVVDAAGEKVGGATSWSGLTDVPVAFPAILGTTSGTAAEGNDARLTDQRVPTDASVIDAKVAADAAISADKLVDGVGNKLLTVAERAKLAGVAAGATLNSSDASLLARANHTGLQFTDTLVETAAAKVMTAAERTKLAGVATGATANSSDASLLSRANHTGTQSAASISDFTEAVQDAVAALLVAGTGVTVSYNDASGTLTLTSTASGGSTDLEVVRDAIGVALAGAGVISVVANDAGDTITITSTATVNSTDVALRDRSTHTGTQAITTVAGLQAALDAKAAVAAGVPAGGASGYVLVKTGAGDFATGWATPPSATSKTLREVEVGQDINAALAAYEGEVRLQRGTHNTTVPIIHSRRTAVRGEGGGATLVKATAAMDSLWKIGNGAPVDKTHLSDITLAANTLAVNGLEINIVGTTGNYGGEPDGQLHAERLYVDDATDKGVWVRGTDSQAWHLYGVRVRRAGNYGVHVNAPDGWVTDCEATTLNTGTGAGFWANSANTHYKGNKAWYCRGYGWLINSSRSTFSACESQDTRLDGWRIDWDKNIFVGCWADSAAYADVGGTLNGADGFYLASGLKFTTMSGCSSFDREQDFAARQRYGFNMSASTYNIGRATSATAAAVGATTIPVMIGSLGGGDTTTAGYKNLGGLLNLR